MAKSKLGTEEASKEVSEKKSTDLEVVDQPTGIALTESVGSVVGDFDMSDLQMPRLNLVQKTGKLGDEFPPGTLLYNRELILAKPNEDPGEYGEALEFSVLNMRKQFQENRDFDPESPPDTFDTLEDVLAIPGASLKYAGDVKPTHVPILTMTLLIKAPNEEISTEFAIEAPDGSMWDLALYTVGGTSYTRVARPVVTRSSRLLKKGLLCCDMLYSMQVRRETISGNSIFCPKLTAQGLFPDMGEDWQEFVRTVLD